MLALADYGFLTTPELLRAADGHYDPLTLELAKRLDESIERVTELEAGDNDAAGAARTALYSARSALNNASDYLDQAISDLGE